VNVDVLYSYLIESTWFFLASWVGLLLTAGVVAFSPIGRGRAHRK